MSTLTSEVAEWRRRAELSSARAAEAERRLAEAEIRAREAQMLAEKYNGQVAEVCSAVVQNLSARCAALEQTLESAAERE
jgi:hypothetical protein